MAIGAKVLHEGSGAGLSPARTDTAVLVDAGSSVIQFISYEGSFTAVGGPADPDSDAYGNRIYCHLNSVAIGSKSRVMRYREGQEVDPDNPYPESTQMMMEMAYWMSIPIGLLLLWLGIKGRVMWLKVWSVGLMALGVGILIDEYFGLLDLFRNSPGP